MKPTFAGIYAIVNSSDGKFYVGSAVNIWQRWHAHRSELRRGVHSNSRLQRAWNKHGEATFQFVVVERVEDVTQLIPIEQEYLDGCQPPYNLSPTAGSCLGFKHSETTKAKFAALLKGKPSRYKGHTNSAETRAKLSAKNKDIPKAAEHKAKIGAAHKGMPKPANIARNQSLEQRIAIRRAAFLKRMAVAKGFEQSELPWWKTDTA